MNPEARAQWLIDHGYEETSEIGDYKVGQRVYHRGQQWPDALANGTGTVERIFHRPAGQSKDIELIIKRDAAFLSEDNTHGFWADFLTGIASGAAGDSSAADGDDPEPPAACAMFQQRPFDFAWCETHDTTFALGAVCPHHTQPAMAPTA